MVARFVRTLLLALALTAVGAASAQAADTISISSGADPTEEVPLPITVTWSSGDPYAEIYVTIKPSGPQGCGASYEADDPNSEDVQWDAGNSATGMLSKNWTLFDPGTYILCGYAQHGESDSAPLAATGPVTLTVRSARATVGIAAPPRVDTGKLVALSFPVTAELGRELYVTAKRAGGRGCEATYALDDPNSEDVLWDESVQGSQTPTTNWTAPTTRATYLLCAYVQESEGDPAPEAVASAFVLVGPDPCVSAKTALKRAQKKVRVAERAAHRNRKAWKRYTKRAKHAHGKKRKHLRKLAKRSKSRYKSAVHSRAKARGQLATAQAAVTAACGAA